jgi:hypothetical protein
MSAAVVNDHDNLKFQSHLPLYLKIQELLYKVLITRIESILVVVPKDTVVEY